MASKGPKHVHLMETHGVDVLHKGGPSATLKPAVRMAWTCERLFQSELHQCLVIQVTDLCCSLRTFGRSLVRLTTAGLQALTLRNWLQMQWESVQAYMSRSTGYASFPRLHSPQMDVA